MTLKKHFKMADAFYLDTLEGYYSSKKEAEAEYIKIYGQRPYSITYKRYNETITIINI